MNNPHNYTFDLPVALVPFLCFCKLFRASALHLFPHDFSPLLSLF